MNKLKLVYQGFVKIKDFSDFLEFLEIKKKYFIKYS